MDDTFWETTVEENIARDESSAENDYDTDYYIDDELSQHTDDKAIDELFMRNN